VIGAWQVDRAARERLHQQRDRGDIETAELERGSGSRYGVEQCGRAFASQRGRRMSGHRATTWHASRLIGDEQHLQGLETGQVTWLLDLGELKRKRACGRPACSCVSG
jgi:hypothetical protein